MIPARPSGREFDQLRRVSIRRGCSLHAEGSALVEFGNTRVLCTASVEEKVPPFLKGRGQGWVTAEYGMLPRSTGTRMQRESVAGKQSGRTQEIQRLIGRSLRVVVDMTALGERTVHIDCDVLQADGGTRTAAITGSWVALHDAVRALQAAGRLVASPLRERVAAVSVGVYKGYPVLDLDYAEDSACETDMNVVMSGDLRLIEVQGTAEGTPFDRRELDGMLDLAERGIRQLFEAQRAAVDSPLDARG